MGYYLSKSSSYYQNSRIRFDRQVENFEQRIGETVSDYQNRYSDVRFSDGAYVGKAVNKDTYQGYMSGYESM